ncbi:hypothetical protein HYT05_01815 [Candidatus Kaiserbacteria bacterium]|nr:hypothetical protein [Candidatus Kaiserbacteria bacterium]
MQAVKARWDKAYKYTTRKHKLDLSFEELFEYFKADCVRHIHVAEVAGVTRERIRQIYNQYFRELFDDKSGSERRKAYTPINRLVKVKRSEHELFNNDTFVKKIVEKARAAGCTVEAIPHLFKGEIHSGRVTIRKLLINGHLCSLHQITTAWQRCISGGRFYASTNIRRSTMIATEALILHTEAAGFTERIFVIPTAILRAAHPSAATRRDTCLYLPTQKLPVYRNIRSHIDYWQHEDAWHLLPPK